MNLPTDLKVPIRSQVSLSEHTTMKVGGEARFFAEPTCESELLELIEYARGSNLPFMIIGKGSNIIFDDEGYDGLCISLLKFEPEKICWDREKKEFTVSAGVALSRLVTVCRDHQIGGFEFLANIPGTVGGAVWMNAGFCRHAGQRQEIGDLIVRLTGFNREGKKEILERGQIQFSYRTAHLDGWIIVEAVLRGYPRSREHIQSEIEKNMNYRNRVQDLQHPSSGSIFKNPVFPLPSAGKLIDQVGLKGFQRGGAMVSRVHGNYLVNLGHATSQDIIQLMNEIQTKVFNETGVFLEPEVKIIKKS
ncbi:MAG: UDP-N-acetylmuramate dehydrogenase [Candidatus Omnitrophica bacterium]|nr:UDP-N-acetylmuramate dehydrogenase [Candidatus Omnitrophota bacterium]